MNVLESFFLKFSELRKDVKTEFLWNVEELTFLIKLKEKNNYIKEEENTNISNQDNKKNITLNHSQTTVKSHKQTYITDLHNNRQTNWPTSEPRDGYS